MKKSSAIVFIISIAVVSALVMCIFIFPIFDYQTISTVPPVETTLREYFGLDYMTVFWLFIVSLFGLTLAFIGEKKVVSAIGIGLLMISAAYFIYLGVDTIKFVVEQNSAASDSGASITNPYMVQSGTYVMLVYSAIAIGLAIYNLINNFFLTKVEK